MKIPRLCVGLVLCAPTWALSQVTIGDALVNHPTDDGATNQVYIYAGGTFGTSGSASTWSFFDNEDNTPNRYVTPLLFEKTNATTYVLRGVGTPRITTEAGAQTGMAFGLLAGSGAIESNYTFGFTDQALSYAGSGNNLTVASVNPGVVDRDPGSTWAFTTVLEFNIVLGQSYIVGGSTAGDFSTVALNSNIDRVYSAQFTSAVPEPAETSAGIGLAALIALGAWRRRQGRRAALGFKL